MADEIVCELIARHDVTSSVIRNKSKEMKMSLLRVCDECRWCCCLFGVCVAAVEGKQRMKPYLMNNLNGVKPEAGWNMYVAYELMGPDTEATPGDAHTHAFESIVAAANIVRCGRWTTEDGKENKWITKAPKSSIARMLFMTVLLNNKCVWMNRYGVNGVDGCECIGVADCRLPNRQK